MTGVGPIGRLGRWTATHFRAVAIAWAVILVGLGVLAPRVEQALSGAGWEASGSESVEARDRIEREFGGLSASALLVVLSSDRHTVDDPAFARVTTRVEHTLAAEEDVSTVVPPRPGTSISRDRHTAVVQAGAGASSNQMVRVADETKGPLAGLGRDGVDVALADLRNRDDYTVFLLSAAKEHWDRSSDPREAMVGGLAHSGRVILAAGAVMVAVFFTFALSGPLPPKEMGVILGVAVLLDALLVRLVLVPVLLRIAGRWAWWLPGWMERVLPDVRFGHA